VFARMHTLETTREKHEIGLGIVREEFLPWIREATGFVGLIGLVDENHEKAYVLTLWRDEAALEASAEAGDKLSGLASAVTGSKRRSLENYEVTLFDIRQ
jgi:hypothetical protein